MEQILDTGQPPKKRQALRRVGSSSMALGVLLSQVTPALATIDNTASASGTYNSVVTPSNNSTVNVNVTPAAPAIQITSKSAGVPTLGLGPNPLVTDAGDTITFTYVIKNSGNITLNTVLPTDTVPTFNGIAGTGTSLNTVGFTPTTPATVLPITLAPGASQTFTSIYTLTALDAYRGAGTSPLVANSAGATGKTPTGTPVNSAASVIATAIIAPGPSLKMTKTSSTPGPVALGATVVYTYTVENNGNVPMGNVKVSDTHEGAAITPQSAMVEQVAPLSALAAGPMGAAASTDATAGDGIWSVLAPGATVTFKYTHTVTQAEVDGG